MPSNQNSESRKVEALNRNEIPDCSPRYLSPTALQRRLERQELEPSRFAWKIDRRNSNIEQEQQREIANFILKSIPQAKDRDRPGSSHEVFGLDLISQAELCKFVLA